MKPSDRIRAQLERARRRGTLVRITRRMRGADRLEGYVVGIGQRWALLATPDNRTRPDGYKAIRIRDVEAIWRHAQGERLQRRSLQLQGEWPLTAPKHEIDLDTTAGLISSLARDDELLSVFIEDDDPDVCFIGRLTATRRKTFVLDEVSPRARWEGAFRTHFSRVSRIDAGGGYEAALLAVAGPSPS